MSSKKKIASARIEAKHNSLIKIPTGYTKNDPEQEMLQTPNPFELLAGLGMRDQSELEANGVLIINDDITKESLAKIYRRMLVIHFDTNFEGDIQIIINSAGGYCDAGWALIDLMGFVKNHVRTIAMGEICSMATDIFIAGDDRIISPNCSIMLHQFSSYSEGNYDDLIAQSRSWEIEMSKNIAHLIRCSKYKTKEQVKKNILKNHDLWLTPTEMKKHGLCDKIFKLQPRGDK